jgi:signal transduction histidine kinase
MKKSIVVKLFLLTSGLCIAVIAGLYIGQSLFFKQFYIHQKVGDIETALEKNVQELSEAKDSGASYIYEQQFYEKHNTWIAQLDDAGNLRYSEDFQAEVRLENQLDAPFLSGKRITVPLYMIVNPEELRDDNPLRPEFLTKTGERIAIEGLLINNQLYPLRVGKNVSNLREENRLENGPLVLKEYEVVPRFKTPTEYHAQYPNVLAYGTIEAIRIPEASGQSRYTNRLFWERVKAFQADLLYGDFSGRTVSVMDYEENNVAYKIFVKKLTDQSGKNAYLFAMTSLQPVDEAAGVMHLYYGYIALGALVLVVLASFYYARRIARPLLGMNEATRKLAGLDFTAHIPVTSDDEIGSLARSINELSGLLHSHILRLEQDIRQEKRLEQTRKEFVAGVSHELKTPLSIIESCLYILRDKPDSQKRDYYFTAMEDEVKRMNLLIEDMLELAKYESGTYIIHMEPFRIDEVLQRVCGKLALELDSKQLLLHTSLLPAEVVGNRTRIEQVVVNFLTNAVRYTPEGQLIIITVTEKQNKVKINIENKGSHIPDDLLDKVWDRFYRIEGSRNRSTGGTGLGLAISKQVLELHGAGYGVANTEDGVEFYFELNTNCEA